MQLQQQQSLVAGLRASNEQYQLLPPPQPSPATIKEGPEEPLIGVSGASPTTSNLATPTTGHASSTLQAQSSSSVTSPSFPGEQHPDQPHPPHQHPPFVLQPSVSSTTGSLGPESKSAMKQRLGRSLDMSEPISVSHVSSSSRSDSVSSGSDVKRLSFLVAKDTQGQQSTDGISWDEQQAGQHGQPTVDSKGRPIKKGMSEFHNGPSYARRVCDIRGWWGETLSHDNHNVMD